MKCECEHCHLRAIFFASIQADQLDQYCQSRVEKRIDTKDIIIKQGEPIREFIYLKEGLVKLSRNTPLGSQIISLGRPYDFVSLLSVFADEKYSYSVSALSPGVVCILNLDEIKKLILENGAFAMKLITTMNKATDRILFEYLDNSQKRLFGRVAGVLLYFADIFNVSIYELPISRKEISQLVGMSIENVIRTISDLRKDKIIRVYGKSIEILDMRRLKMIRDLN